MYRDDPTMAWDIWNAIQRIKQYSEGLTRETFETNVVYQDAIVRQFEILGEAARQLSDAFRSAHSEIDWPGWISFRNRLIHAYFDIDLDVVWRGITQEIDGLASAIRPLINLDDADPSQPE